ncbi:MAG: 16S rRNA (guanine(527)-N(7))-methyltransferase RsmG [Eubacteriales bacterium]
MDDGHPLPSGEQEKKEPLVQRLKTVFARADGEPPKEADEEPFAGSFARMYLELPELPDEFRTPELAAQMASLAETLLSDNQKFNLTAITEPREVLVKHILDSLLCARLIAGVLTPQDTTLLDVGSGAGFPALPIAAAIPQLAVAAIDSTARKCVHMNDSAAEAEIPNFAALAARAEILALNQDYREKYDFVTARAVANLPVLSELCLPFVRPGGLFIAMKGKSAPEEERAAAHAIASLGGKIEEERRYFVPGDESPRYFLLIRKISPTPAAYPRHFAQISKKPL